MPDLVIMPPSPNKPPPSGKMAGQSSSNKPAPPSTNRSIKDYFNVMDSPSTAATSKKRKAAGDLPAAKKPKPKPAAASSTSIKAKKGGAKVAEPTQSSDKENGNVEADVSMVSEGEEIRVRTTTTTTTKPKAPRKARAPKGESATAKKKADKKEKADQEADDAALAAQLAQEVSVATPSPPVSAPKFQAINVFKVDTRDVVKAHTFKEVNPAAGGSSKRDEVKSDISKATKSKEPKAPKEEKAPKEKAPKPPKGPKDKARKSATEIKEWKNYEPKSSAAPLGAAVPAKGIAKFLEGPVEAVRAPPKLEPCPELQILEISYSLGVIHDRLAIREFFVRFEKALKIVPKYIGIVNNPDNEWTDLTYRSIIVCLLRLLYADFNPEIPLDILEAGIKQLEKTAPDDPALWKGLINILHGYIDDDKYENADWSHQKPRGQLIVRLIGLVMSCGIIKEKLDNDAAALKEEEKTTAEKIKRVKTQWEATRQEISKSRLTAAPDEKAKLELKYQTEQSWMKTEISKLEAKSWLKKRKLQPRQRPLGIDAKGNTYWLFIQRENDKSKEDWGRYIVIERAPDLPHPSGSIPAHLSSTSNTTSSPSSSDAEGPTPTTEDIKKLIWYHISTSTQAESLVKWIRTAAEQVFYERATKAAVKAAAAKVVDISTTTAPLRQRMKAVEVPLTPGMQKMLARGPDEARRLGVVVREERWDRKEGVDRQSVEELCKEVKRVGGFWRVEEEERGRRRI